MFLISYGRAKPLFECYSAASQDREGASAL